MYGTPITVWEQDGRPVRFMWEGRIYVVRRILDHWVTVRSDFSPEAGSGRPRRRFWRVQVGPEPGADVYELRYDSVGEQWLLSRTHR
ncbi:hypothetical protein HDA32_001389 [Spinactinospora alkalitolerans]|uniref:DUF6504 domain-containing protein n=1 Tax=Spinactinospora alkalitolerans TaxID=687207 RepID=A0A852TQL7_9ACTN|nr:DUF6504 family protein [Spinactinospora alkalitolerans]NYE46269.1 hypothetical protein [Spinactinospora alkalitolerans]